MIARDGFIVRGEIINEGATLAASEGDLFTVKFYLRSAEERDGKHGGSIAEVRGWRLEVGSWDQKNARQRSGLERPPLHNIPKL